MNSNKSFWNKGFGAVAVALAVLLSGCGSSGDADPSGVVNDSITITGLTGTDTGAVGQAFNMEAEVVVTGDVPADKITYKWVQSEGFAVANIKQVDGSYRSTLTYTPVAAGIVTMKLTATTSSGRVSEKSKTVTVNP